MVFLLTVHTDTQHPGPSPNRLAFAGSTNVSLSRFTAAVPVSAARCTVSVALLVGFLLNIEESQPWNASLPLLTLQTNLDLLSTRRQHEMWFTKLAGSPGAVTTYAVGGLFSPPGDDSLSPFFARARPINSLHEVLVSCLFRHTGCDTLREMHGCHGTDAAAF